MKAIVYKNYGSPEVLKLEEVQKPSPKANEILIKIKATAVNSGDYRMRKADPWAVRLFFGLTKPKLNILGGVYSGEVVQIGQNVKSVKVGDEIFGVTDMRFGAYAEYMCLPENGFFALKPKNLTHAESAVIPFGSTTAWHFLKLAQIKPGQKVLVYGASGAVGTAAVQIAKALGAIVTGVCSTANLDMVKSLGADKVIDYTKEDFTKNGEQYDVIFESVNKISFAQSIKSLSPTGILILSAAGMGEMLKGAWTNLTTKRKVLTGVNSQSVEHINFFRELAESGKLKPVIDKTFALEQMAEAHTYVEKGHKKGNVAIII